MLNKALKIFCLSILVLLLGIPSLAQNTKGDKPAPTPRETRFKTPKKSKQKVQRSRRVKQETDRPGQRVSPARGARAKGERPGKPIRPMFSRSKPREQQKPWKGDITGRRIKPRGDSRAAHVYPQPQTTNYSSRELRRSPRHNVNPNVKRVRRMQDQEERKAHVGRPIRPIFHKSRPQHRERPWRGDLTGRRIRATPADKTYTRIAGNYPRIAEGAPRRVQRAGVVPPRIWGRAGNIFSGRSFYVNNRSRRPPYVQGGSNRLALKMLTGPGSQKPRFKSGKVAPRSASAAYMSRRSTNIWAHFPRPKRKQGAYTTDLAGKRLRTKNYETRRPVLTNPTLNYQKRIAAGERPYKGPAAGGHISRTKTGQRAWKGDVAHYRIRGGKPPGGERAFLGFLRGGGFRSATRPGPRTRIAGRAPGIGARGIGGYQGNIKAGKRGFRDQGEEYSGNIKTGRRGFQDQGEEYSGNIRAGKRGFRDQGEKYSGNIRAGKRGFSDQGEEYSGNIRAGRRGFRDQGEEYSGNIKAGKRGFRDQGEEYSGNIRGRRRGFRDQGEEYSGNIKAGKRGFRDQGEEYSGNIKAGKHGFRDQGEEYSGNIRGGRRIFRDQGEEYSGNIKAGKRRFTYQGEEHRGNIKGAGRGFSDQGEEYTGNIKAGKRGFTYQGEEHRGNIRGAGRGFSDQGEEYTGNIKARRPDRGGGSVSGKLWNNEERPIAVRTPRHDKGGDFSGNVKIARNHYSRNPKSAEGAIRGVKASASTQKADTYSRGTRRDWEYARNPSSDDDAQRTREPGRAFYRSSGYHGNLKVRRFDLFGKRDNLHPDAKFVKLNKNNVPEEKDMFTNFKLWWARLFKKSETQPDHLKEKGRTPRYDKGESGLWYE